MVVMNFGGEEHHTIVYKSSGAPLNQQQIDSVIGFYRNMVAIALPLVSVKAKEVPFMALQDKNEDLLNFKSETIN